METIIFDAELSTSEIIAVAKGAKIELSTNFKERVQQAYELVQTLVKDKGYDLYGATTGVAGQVRIKRTATDMEVSDFARNYFKAHASACGDPISPEISRATLAARIWMFGHGKSGVSPSFVDAMVKFLNSGAAVVVPRDGSLGASGDLCSLGTIAAAFLRLQGTNVYMPNGSLLDASQAMPALGIPLPEFGFKDALGHSNGVTFSSVMALYAHNEAKRLCNAAIHALVLNMEALGAWLDPFEEGNDSIRPHKNTDKIRKLIRELTSDSSYVASLNKLDGQHANRPKIAHWNNGQASLEMYEGFQSPYSIRAAAEYFAPALGAITDLEQALETELLDSVGDNPVILNDTFIHAAHFHGQPIATCINNIKARIAELAILLKEQASILIRGDMNQGLGDYLSLGKGYSGYMILEYTMTSLAGEIKSLADPDTLTSMYSAGGQENIVAMLPLAVKNLRRQLKSFAKLVAGSFLMSGQAISLRMRAYEACEECDQTSKPGSFGIQAINSLKDLIGQKDGYLAHIDHEDSNTTITWQMETITNALDRLVSEQTFFETKS